MEFNDLLTADRHEAGAEMEIKDPATGNCTFAYLTLKGVDSKTFRRCLAEFNRKSMEAGANREALGIELLVGVTTGWRGIKSGGEEMPFTQDAVRRLYTDSPAIRQQVDSWIADRRNFTKG